MKDIPFEMRAFDPVHERPEDLFDDAAVRQVLAVLHIKPGDVGADQARAELNRVGGVYLETIAQREAGLRSISRHRPATDGGPKLNLELPSRATRNAVLRVLLHDVAKLCLWNGMSVPFTGSVAPGLEGAEAALAAAQRHVEVLLSYSRLPDGTGRRRDVEALLERVRRARRNLDLLDADTRLLLASRLGPSRHVWEALQHLSIVLTTALKESNELHGRVEDRSLDQAIGDLAELFETLTSQPATHTPGHEGENEGRPTSRFGRFVMAFFAVVSSRPDARAISSAMVRVVRLRRPKSR